MAELGFSHTRRIVLVRKVSPICRAGYIDAPESAADIAVLQTRQINVAIQGAISKRLGKIGLMDVVVIELPDEDGEVIVTVCADHQGSFSWVTPTLPLSHRSEESGSGCCVLGLQC